MRWKTFLKQFRWTIWKTCFFQILLTDKEVTVVVVKCFSWSWSWSWSSQKYVTSLFWLFSGIVLLNSHRHQFPTKFGNHIHTGKKFDRLQGNSIMDSLPCWFDRFFMSLTITAQESCHVGPHFWLSSIIHHGTRELAYSDTWMSPLAVQYRDATRLFVLAHLDQLIECNVDDDLLDENNELFLLVCPIQHCAC